MFLKTNSWLQNSVIFLSLSTIFRICRKAEERRAEEIKREGRPEERGCCEHRRNQFRAQQYRNKKS